MPPPECGNPSISGVIGDGSMSRDHTYAADTISASDKCDR